MNETEYNAADGVRRSDLWKMADSPEKFRYYLDHPAEQTPAMAFGSACHKMILEPADFGNEYAIAPAIDRRTKVGKAEWEAFCEDNSGKTIISAEDAETMLGMEESLERNPLANALIRGEGETEKAFFWTDAETGEACKIKCDRIVEYRGKTFVVDYKTTTGADTETFSREILRLGYHFQAGMYTEGVQAGLGLKEQPGFIFVAQEKKAPFSVNVIELPEELLTEGTRKFHELLERMHACKMLDIWPGYVESVPNDAEIPGWMINNEEE